MSSVCLDASHTSQCTQLRSIEAPFNTVEAGRQLSKVIRYQWQVSGLAGERSNMRGESLQITCPISQTFVRRGVTIMMHLSTQQTRLGQYVICQSIDTTTIIGLRGHTCRYNDSKRNKSQFFRSR